MSTATTKRGALVAAILVLVVAFGVVGVCTSAVVFGQPLRTAVPAAQPEPWTVEVGCPPCATYHALQAPHHDGTAWVILVDASSNLGTRRIYISDGCCITFSHSSG